MSEISELRELVEKAVLTQDSSAGAPQGQAGSWFERRDPDAFGMVARHLEVDTPMIDAPRMSLGDFAGETSVATSVTYGGTLAGPNITTETQVLNVSFTAAAKRDIVNLSALIAEEIMAAAGARRSTLAAAALKASANLTADRAAGEANEFACQRVITDTDTVAADAVIKKATEVPVVLEDVLDGIDDKYHGNGFWVISVDMLKALLVNARSGNQNTFARNLFEHTGIPNLWHLFGSLAIVSGTFGLSATVAAGDVYGYYGDFSQGLYYTEYGGVEITEFEESKPGAYIVRATFRFSADVANGKAIVGLEINT